MNMKVNASPEISRSQGFPATNSVTPADNTNPLTTTSNIAPKTFMGETLESGGHLTSSLSAGLLGVFDAAASLKSVCPIRGNRKMTSTAEAAIPHRWVP